jgi:hypothetical protein
MEQPRHNVLSSENFRITLNIAPGESFNPGKHIQFEPPRGSQALKQALQSSYPYLKTHQERVREAVTDFYLKFLTEGESLLDIPNTPDPNVEPQLSTTQQYATFMFYEVIYYFSANHFSSSHYETQPFSKQLYQTTSNDMASMMGVFELPSSEGPQRKRPRTEAQKKRIREIKAAGGACERHRKNKKLVLQFNNVKYMH